MPEVVAPAPVMERVRVLSNRKNWTGTRTITLHSEAISNRLQPGQFVMLRPGDGTDPYLPRGILATAWDSDSQSIEVVFSPADPRHARLAEIVAGTPLDAFGPVGRKLPLAEFGERVSIISSSPLGERFTDLLEETCPHSRFTMVLLDMSAPPQELRLAAEDATILLIGDVRLFSWAKAQLPQSGPRAIALNDAIVGCGVGACLACPAMCRDGVRRICVEGPWFELADLELSK